MSEKRKRASRKRKRDEAEREKHIERRRTRIETSSKPNTAKKPKIKRVKTRRSASTQTKKPVKQSREIPVSKPQPISDGVDQRIITMRNRTNNLLQQANENQRRINRLDNQIQDLPERVNRLRRSNYRFMPHLENQSHRITDKWHASAPTLRRTSQDLYIRSTNQGNELNSQLNLAPSGNLYTVETLITSLQQLLNEYNLYVNNELGGYNSELMDLEGDLRVAESTMDLLREHSFKWKQGESPVIAIKAHHLDKDLHGILTLTNLRFIFEEEREEVLKKVLFIPTEKKMVREVVIDQPIGAVESLSGGSVGFFKGAGLYIKFKKDSGGGELRLDTKGNEGEQVSRYYEYVITGSADDVLGEEEEKEFKPVVCPHCTAPYTEEVYRGQTSVECKYCSTIISL